MQQIQIGDIIDNEYEIIKQLSQGSFGIVYYGRSIKKNLNVAIKVEKKEMASYSSLDREASILSKLKGVPQIPELYWYGDFKNCNVMVSKLLGRDLIHYQRQYQQFTVTCINSIAYQLLWILEQVHRKNIIHRDIKPENILSKNESDKIYLIDFGISKDEDQTTLQKKKQLPFIGTSRYASIAAHLGLEQSAKDDLESLGYVLVYLVKQKLPWMNVEKKDHFRVEKIGKLKEETTIEDLCFGCPNSFVKFFKYVKDLKPNTKPKYTLLRGLFLNKLENNIELGLDWTNQLTKNKLKKRKQHRHSCDPNFQSCGAIIKSNLGEMNQIHQYLKTIIVSQDIGSSNGTDSMQFSIVETKGSDNSIKVGFTLSDNHVMVNQYARVSTFEGIIDPVMTLKAEQQLMERENQDLEIKYNLLHFKSVYFNYKNPIQQQSMKQNCKINVTQIFN